MKLRIKHKLFLLLLVANLLLATGIYLINSWSFSAGFVQYISRTEQNRFKPFIAKLVEHYQTTGNWSWITDQHQQWRDLIGHYIHQRERPLPRQQLDNQQSRRPRHTNNRFKRPPPPHRGRLERPSSNRSTSLVIDSHLLLRDAQAQLVIGNSRHLDQVHWLAIHDDEQRLIGHLGFRRLQHLDEGLNKLFSEQQKNSFLYAALGMILISGLLAIPIASRLVRPMQKLADATETLSSGDYSTRFSEHRTDELGDLARHFNDLAHTLEGNQLSRQQWLADISHELRTPVAILLGEIEALQDGIRIITPATLTSLHEEAIRLSSLINDLHELTLADLGALDYHMEPINLAELIQNRIETFKLKSKIKNLLIETHFPVHPVCVWGDNQRLAQVFTNLMQNSLRYTDEGGTIRVSIQLKDKHYHLNWSDSKPAVDEQDLPHLFDRLYRTEKSRNRAQGGSGLGLAITEKMIKAHQGSIKAAFSELGGLSILITIPEHRDKYARADFDC